ncbi:ComEC/Rec2 family competence protein [uncultured Psychrobacter sp.]|uniref:ComEC/Rec2 family competence protein n=1 Tax=uncultured Psychrobacter sp. TaxID=259303 RepID=UPI003458228B
MQVYWLVGILVITVMVGTLDVAESVTLPISPLLESMTYFSIWPLLLIALVFLCLFTPRKAISSAASGRSFFDGRAFIPISFSVAARYLLVAVLASMLIIGSALQALSSYQRAQATQINESMRVQAWVTIKGISDSVYDPATNSGYRQVATLQVVSPLVSEMSGEDLDKIVTDYNDKLNVLNAVHSDKTASIEYQVLLNAYPKAADDNLESLNTLQPGAQLLLTATLAPLPSPKDATNNPSGFDSYRWLRGRHIDGMANIIAIGTPINTMNNSSISNSTDSSTSDSYLQRLRTSIDRWRWQLRQHFYQNWELQTVTEQQAKAVTLSLLTGDRSLISRDTKDLYQLAGISHLLAISGTHVLFLAIMLAGAATLLIDRVPALYRIVARWQVRWWVMIGAAFVYALFTGFDVPAARTAWMLLAIGLVRLTLLPISTMRVLLALAVLMAWIDPYVLWQAGYWLSFIAVALLLKYDDTVQKPATKATRQQRSNVVNRSSTNLIFLRLWSLFKRIVKLQFWLFIALLPITLFLFGKASLWGLIINLFAIGLFGWVIVPLNLLAGLCYLVLPAVADVIWALVSIIVNALHELIIALTSQPVLTDAWLYTPINTAILLIVLLALSPWLLPRGLLSRWLVLPPLTLLVMSVYANQQTLLTTPTLYVLPTGDQYLSATVLQYPVAKGSSNSQPLLIKDSISWLFLADHRSDDKRKIPSTLSPDKLSASLEQQLRTLSIKRLEGIVIQTSVPVLTDTLPSKQKTGDNNAALLPMTVMKMSHTFPTNYYWQAGRHERWATIKNLSQEDSSSNPSTQISAQGCIQGKTWQLANGSLVLHVLTGWSEIEDSRVWDCAIAIDSRQPIQVVQYNTADPLQSPRLTAQRFDTSLAVVDEPHQNVIHSESLQNKSLQSRIILDAATHERSWQLWSLLCKAQPFAIDPDAGYTTTWLTYNAVQSSTDAISRQRVDEIMTYDNQPLKTALTLSTDF